MILDQPVSGSTLTSSASSISPCLIRRLRPDSSKTQVVVEELCNSEVYKAVTSFDILVAGCCIFLRNLEQVLTKKKKPSDFKTAAPAAAVTSALLLRLLQHHS
jgi:hypothetical protein